MKIKFFAIYIAAGVAFLGFSLWVFLSKGKNAKAIRAKYKMGGIMLTACSMLMASACQCSPTVTCYEPMDPKELEGNYTNSEEETSPQTPPEEGATETQAL